MCPARPRSTAVRVSLASDSIMPPPMKLPTEARVKATIPAVLPAIPAASAAAELGASKRHSESKPAQVDLPKIRRCFTYAMVRFVAKVVKQRPSIA